MKLFTTDTIKRLNLFEISFTFFIFYLYFLIIYYLVPEGINKAFLVEINRVSLYLMLISILVTALRLLLFNNINIRLLRQIEFAKLSDLILIFLPITPIVQYIILNQDILSIYSSLYLLGFFVLATIVMIVVLPIFLSLAGSRVIFLSLGLAITFILCYMPTLSFNNLWYEKGSLIIQLPVFLVIFLLSTFIYKINHNFLKLGIVIFFISNTFTSLNSLPSPSEEKGTENIFLSKVLKKPMTIKPDIYLLTYDSYVSNETMLQYGIDNGPQESYLNDKGFKIYDGIYSIGPDTISTMTRVLDASLVQRNSALGGNSHVHNTLRNQGYTLAGVHKSSHFWNKSIPKLDYFFPESIINSHETILYSVLEGEFKFDAPIKFGRYTAKEFITKKRNFMNSSSHPKFLYTHTGPSHSQNSGKCRSDEKRLFKRRLYRSNQEMKKDIEVINNNNTNALIIINGDHGPYLTGNCTALGRDGFMQKSQVSRLDVQDRYGAFLAIKWPKSLEILDEKIIILQDIFPAIFATLLKDRSIFSEIQIPPNTLQIGTTSGVTVNNGMILGGIDDGLPLYPR